MNQEECPSQENETVPAGALPPWTIGDPKPPSLRLAQLDSATGPGVLMAGASIGSGEWLAGPGVTAQYGHAALGGNPEHRGPSFATWSSCAMHCTVANRSRSGPSDQAGTQGVDRFLRALGVWAYLALQCRQRVGCRCGHHARTSSESRRQRSRACSKLLLFLIAFIPLIFGNGYKTLERIMTGKLAPSDLPLFCTSGLRFRSGR